jgi:hypothetical protein
MPSQGKNEETSSNLMKHDSETLDAQSSFRAIGIAFVVDRIGKGASM